METIHQEKSIQYRDMKRLCFESENVDIIFHRASVCMGPSQEKKKHKFK